MMGLACDMADADGATLCDRWCSIAYVTSFTTARRVRSDVANFLTEISPPRRHVNPVGDMKIVGA